MVRTIQRVFDVEGFSDAEVLPRAKVLDKDDYDLFVEKFKPKKTTDDCYTPLEVFDVIKAWAMKEYGFTEDRIVRPFYPGGDYENFDYPSGCVVLDNPPFSILSKIVRFYVAHNIDFLLFAPHLTLFQNLFKGEKVCALVVDSDIIYENGAHVNTSFLTSMDSAKVRTAPELRRAINDVQRKGHTKPILEYPRNATTSARLSIVATVPFHIERDECIYFKEFVEGSAFGGGILMTDAVADRLERATEEAERERERQRLLLGEAEALRQGFRVRIERGLTPTDKARLRALNEKDAHKWF